jgi:hypothetical protein
MQKAGYPPVAAINIDSRIISTWRRVINLGQYRCRNKHPGAGFANELRCYQEGQAKHAPRKPNALLSAVYHLRF